MPITPNFSLWSPDDSDDWDLTIDLAAMQASVDSALVALPGRGAFVGTNDQRLALATPDLRDGITFYATDTKRPWRRVSGAWIDTGTDYVSIATVASQAITSSGGNKVLVFTGATPITTGNAISMNATTGVATVAVAGTYQVECMGTWSAGGTAGTARFLMADTPGITRRSILTVTGVTTSTLSATLPLAAGATLSMNVFQNSGVTLNIGAESGAPTSLTIQRIGP